jgi:homopolymeric O-antigen transport system permease protein
MSLTTTEGASELEAGAATPNTTRRNAEFSRPVAPSVPDKPLIIIERSRSWRPADLSELWAYRELLYFLIWRDVKVRYKQTLLGVVWVIIQPLATMLIFTLLFGRLAGLETRTGGIPYPLFAFAGLLPWTFFSNAVSNSSNSLVTSAQLITKIYFPRMIIPAAAVTAGLVDFALSFVVLAVLMAYYRVSVTWSLLLLPALIAFVVLLALGVGMLLAGLNVKYRDVRHAVPFAMQIWMFASPVIYPTTLVPERWRWVLALNPMTGIIEAFRAVLFGSRIDWNLLAFSAAVTLALLIYSCFAFRRMEKSFADVI